MVQMGFDSLGVRGEILWLYKLWCSGAKGFRILKGEKLWL